MARAQPISTPGAARPPMLRLEVERQPRVLAAGAQARPARRKSLALLAYLLLQPGSHDRRRVADALWPDAGEAEARNSLRVVLSDIRKVLGEHALRADDREIAAEPGAWSGGCDWWELQALLEAVPDGGLPPQALLRWQPMQSGLAGEGWFEPLAGRAALMQRAALHRWTRHLAQSAQADAALSCVRRLLELDPADEAAHRQAMQLLWSAGDRDAALAQFEACEQALAALGARPCDETLQLHQRLQASHARGRLARLGNLPHPATAFVGREDELDRIQTLLRTARLLTVHGSAGTGKTRLALQTAAEVAHDFDGGVWWADFSAQDDVRRVPDKLAAVLGVRPGRQEVLESVAQHIGAQRMLIVLDNCESALGAVAACVEALLRRCARLVLLATSREPLARPGEVVWTAPPLRLPSTRAGPDELLESDALRLFEDRARRSDPTFKLGAHNVAAAARVCRRLLGLPLAIELAAARLGEMPLAALADELGRSELPGDATGDRRSALASAVEWSCRQLAPAEWLLFQRLWVFAGGWSVASAAAVAVGADAEAPAHPSNGSGFTPLRLSAPASTALLLDSLERKGLVRRERDDDGERFHLLDLLREHSRSLCARHASLLHLVERHGRHMLELAQQSEKGLRGAFQRQLLRNLARDGPNFEAALDWSERQASPMAALQITVALGEWWKRSGQFRAGIDRLRTALDLDRLDDPGPVSGVPPGSPLERLALRARALAWLGDLSCRLGLLAEAREAAERALATACDSGDPAAEVPAWQALSLWALGADALGPAFQAGRRALELAERLGDCHQQAVAHNRLAEAARLAGDAASSVAHNRAALNLAEQMHDGRAVAIGRMNLGLLAIETGRPAEAVRLLRTSGDDLLREGERHQWTYILRGLGLACRAQGRLVDCARLWGALEAWQRETRHALQAADAERHAADVAALDLARADAAMRQAWAEGDALDADGVLTLVGATPTE